MLPGVGVEAAQRFIEDEHVWVGDDRLCQRDEAKLPGRQRRRALAGEGPSPSSFTAAAAAACARGQGPSSPRRGPINRATVRCG